MGSSFAWLSDYCRIQIKSTPLRDRDTPDEIFFSSLHFGSRDIAKISSVIAIELYILAMFGVKFIAARAKISHLLAESPILSQNFHIWLTVTVRTFRQSPYVTLCKNENSCESQALVIKMVF